MKLSQIVDEACDIMGGVRPGTKWVAPGEGSTWRDLYFAFIPTNPDGSIVERSLLPNPAYFQGGMDKRTNLLLTGLPLTDYDRQRWESGNVE